MNVDDQSSIGNIIPETLEPACLSATAGRFDRCLWGKMATLFIRKPRRSPDYAYVFFFDIDHFPRHILPVNPKRPGYMKGSFVV